MRSFCVAFDVELLIQFRSAANHSALEPTQGSKLHATSGGKLQKGAKLIVDYDYQPGSMGFHTYDLWEGLRGHFPYPPSEQQGAALAAGSSRSRRGRLGAGLGSPHTDFGSGYQSGDLFDPLYFEIAIDSAVKLLDFFAKYGRPVEYINLVSAAPPSPSSIFFSVLFHRGCCYRTTMSCRPSPATRARCSPPA